MKHQKRFAYLKLFSAFLIIIILALNFSIANSLKYDTYGDAKDFIGLGVSLAKFQKYGSIDFSKQGGLIQAFKDNNIKNANIEFKANSTWRPPVWPFLIAGIFLIFGYNLTYLLLFKFLLHLIGTFVFYKTLRLFKLKEALVIMGALIYGIHPAWQIYSRVYLSEPITLFFITLWIYLLVKFVNGKLSWWPQAMAAGILILSHPYFIFLPFSVWLILFLKKQISLKLFLISSFVCATIVSGWIIRNFIALETDQVVITTSSGAVMAKGWNKDVLANHTNTQGDLANEGIVLEDYPNQEKAPVNEVERMKLYKDASLYFIKSNPQDVFPIIITKLKSAFNPFPETAKPGLLETGRWIFQVFGLIGILYTIFLTRETFLKSLALGFILATVCITILTYSGFRFRMPQIGGELLFLVYSLQHLLLKYKLTGFGSKKNLNF